VLDLVIKLGGDVPSSPYGLPVYLSLMRPQSHPLATSWPAGKKLLHNNLFICLFIWIRHAARPIVTTFLW